MIASTTPPIAAPAVPPGTSATEFGEPNSGRRTCVTVQGKITIPHWIDDLESFRRWAHSDSYPETGQVSFLAGEIWVDLSMEELVTHNKLKSAFAFAFMKALEADPIGEYIADGMLWTHAEANVSTKPDALLYRWETIESKRLIPISGRSHGHVELSGTPDLLLEVVSDSSVRKDTITLRDLYWKAGVEEYWVADARRDAVAFEILHRGQSGYEIVPSDDGWQTSRFFNQQFRLNRITTRLETYQFVVESRKLEI